MQIVLMRHGLAARQGPWSDTDRPLTAEGEAGIVRLGRLWPRGTPMARIVTSPARRCHETALLLAEALGNLPVSVEDTLAMETPLKVILEGLRQHALGSFVVVGHAPDLGDMAAALLGADVALRFECGGAAAFTVDTFPPHQPGRLDWLLTPDTIAPLDRAAG